MTPPDPRDTLESGGERCSSNSEREKADKTPSSWWKTWSAPTASWGPGGDFEVALLESRPGFALLEITGRGAELLKNEAGGHRFQRIPPTERSGRVHSSSITVAVFAPPPAAERIKESDVSYKFTRGSGAGGQNRNKVETAVIATHTPTGTVVRVESERSQHQNKRIAFELLSARVAEASATEAETSIRAARRDMIGSGQRGDKRRTIAAQRDEAVDHHTGRRMRARDYLRGEMDKLWKA